MDDWNTLKTRYQESFDHFVEIADQMPAAKQQAKGVCGRWSPHEVIAHIAAWNWEGVRVFKEAIDGNTVSFRSDVDHFNAEAVEARQHRLYEQVLTELRQAHEALAVLSESLTNEQVAEISLYERWLLATIHEYDIHGAELKAWLL